MNRRKNAAHSPDSIADLEDLHKIASDRKEELDYKIIYIKNKIYNLDLRIKSEREGFIAFCAKYKIDVNFPIIHDVLADDVMPDTDQEKMLEAIPIYMIMDKNFPDQQLAIARQMLVKNYVTLQEEMNEYIDDIRKMKLHKSDLETDLQYLEKTREQYIDKVKEKQTEYEDRKKDLVKFNELYKNLLEFKYLFIFVPGDMTSEAASNDHNSKIDKYSPFYVGKKKAIKKIADKLLEIYTPPESNTAEQMAVLNEISALFSDPA